MTNYRRLFIAALTEKQTEWLVSELREVADGPVGAKRDFARSVLAELDIPVDDEPACDNPWANEPDDSSYRRDMIDAGRGHLLR